MSQDYDPRPIERRWQQYWLERRTFAAPNPGEPGFDPAKPKYYVLDMFPYPSGSGLHVGHPVGYIGSDIVARRKRMEGFNVLHPMGWDAFGLPAEQYAIQTGKHPAETTTENIANFRRQLRLIGLSYDWEREVNTSSVDFYRWTQWLFTRLYDQGLVYRTDVPVWWCEELKTVLANEEVINGRSERGGFPCERRPLKQWMFRITRYAERLLADLETVDWPESIKAMQREWIGRSDGGEIDFPIADLPGESLTVFTTRPDTLWGATFMVVAPEHPLLPRLTSDEKRAEVEAYVRQASMKTDLERTDLAKEKTGVATGGFALNPLLDADDPAARIPIFVADYVLYSYGTGAIMAVPGHDERDFEFARRYDLPIVEVVRPPEGTPGLADGVCFTGDGTAVSSGPIDGLPSPEAIRETIRLLGERGCGRARTTYKLRDWLFSRQRYWGEPFPLIHLEDGTVRRVRDEGLPVVLPAMDDFTPSADGSPPLARAAEWRSTTDPESGKAALRDTDTMPGWAGSCWYWLRFMDPGNDGAAFSPEAERYWGPVDLYIGGASHAVLHLLYARFWHKVFYDIGLVSQTEPFQKLFNQGILTAPAYRDASGRSVPSGEVGPDGDGWVHRESGRPVEQFVAAMSKSLRNVVNPDDVIEEHGADSFRLYEMFMSPLAYGVEDGRLRWGAPAGGHSYSSPQLSRIAGRRSVPQVTDAGLTLLDPVDGSVMLQYNWPSDFYRVLQPLMIGDSTLLMSTGLGVGTRRLELRSNGDGLEVEERWTSRGLKPHFNDLVAHQGFLYGLDPNILVCVDLETGERQWKGGRYGHGQLLLLPDADQLLVLTETGDVVLVRATPERLEELARVEVLHAKTWNHPVLVGDRLYVRNGEEAVALEMPLG